MFNLEENFRTRITFSDKLKFRGCTSAPATGFETIYWAKGDTRPLKTWCKNEVSPPGPDLTETSGLRLDQMCSMWFAASNISVKKFTQFLEPAGLATRNDW